MNAGACRVCGSEKTVARFPAGGADLKLCRECGVTFRTGTASAADLAGLYDREYFLETWPGSLGRFFSAFDPARHHKTRFFSRQLSELERLVNGQRRLLDVGCANGVFVWLARERGWEAEGLEVSPFAVEWGRKQFGVVIHEGDIHNISPEPGYDVITFWDTLEHLPDPRAALHAAVSRLHPGGYLVILTPDTQSLVNSLVHTAYRLAPNRGRALIQRLYHTDHLCFFDRNSLAAALVAQGLQIHWIESYDEHPADTETRGLLRAGVYAVHYAASLLQRRHELMIYARKPLKPRQP